MESRFNPSEPPWYGPVWLVVWEGKACEGLPYPEGPEATATVFWAIAWRIPYPTLNQWVMPFFHPNLQMKF